MDCLFIQRRRRQLSSLRSFLISAAQILLSLTRVLLILSATVMDTIRGRPC
jgi:hypothetical protein